MPRNETVKRACQAGPRLRCWLGAVVIACWLGWPAAATAQGQHPAVHGPYPLFQGSYPALPGEYAAREYAASHVPFPALQGEYPASQGPLGSIAWPPEENPAPGDMAPRALEWPSGNLPPHEAPAESLPPPATAASPELTGPQAELGPWWLPEGWEQWFAGKYWSGGVEVGINATEGNSEAFSSRIGANFKRKSGRWELKTDATYAKATAKGRESQHNALFNAGYERAFGDTPWSHFGKLNLEYDEFKAFDLRVAMNLGLSHQLLKDEASSLKVRFGAGVSHEINSPDERWVREAVFGSDLARQLNERQKLALTADYFPEWEDFTNFRLVTDASWTVALDDDSKLSLKVSANNRYDSTPNGRRPNDVIYGLLLLWQL